MAKTAQKYDRAAKNYDFSQQFIEKLLFGKLRTKAFKEISGKVIKIGVGTGKNLPYYTRDADVTAIDFSEKMLEKAKERRKNLHISNVTLLKMNAQNLRFNDNSFDTAISTFVFCTVPDPLKGLSEVYRVIKPDGKAVFIEHMKSGSFLLNIFLYLMNLMSVPLLGTSMIRETQKNIESAGFKIESVEKHVFDVVRLIIARK